MAHHYDIVHTHTPIASVVSRAAHATLAPAARARLVYTAHGFHFAPQNRRRANLPYVAAERLMGRWTDRLVVINRTDFEQALRFGVVPAERLVHHPGIGVDTAWYAVTADVRAAADRFRADLGIPTGAPVVTMAGELRINKHPELAVEALVRSRRSRLHLVLAGEGPMRERIVAQAAAAGVTDRVHLVGMLADIRTAFAASVATLLPSQREGLSRAVLESLAMGIPVIGSDIRGIADVVAPDGGVLVPLGDVDALADALALAADERVPFDAAAVRHRIERHGLAHLLGLHEELYDSLLSDERAPSRPNTTASPAGVAGGR
jgi:glycosyltransferase involved in cell wall biosynthesis